ncbi:aquaporin AQPAe.a-like [Planococcus citri]|uniref:aquaporin AQPAe.a-like n=1 Tax=Planococcus citri TaxID=170843 RepID=UPI0031F9F2F2
MKFSQKLLDLSEIFVAEVIATTFLLYFGCIGLIPSLDNSSQSVTPLHAGILWGIVVLGCIVIFGPISGAHMNPAVTLSALIYERISLLAGVVYFVAECLGACLGIWLVKLTTPIDQYPENFCCVKIHPTLSIYQGFLSEFMGTSILIYAVCSAWDPRSAQHQDSMPIKLGFVVSTIVIAMGHYTSACVNPARGFGPALVNGFWDHQWVYWMVPLSASVITTLIYKYTFLKKYQDSSLPKLDYETHENTSTFKLRPVH